MDNQLSVRLKEATWDDQLLQFYCKYKEQDARYTGRAKYWTSFSIIHNLPLTMLKQTWLINYITTLFYGPQAPPQS